MNIDDLETKQTSKIDERFLNVSLQVTQLAQDGYLKSYTVIMSPLCVVARVKCGEEILSADELHDYYTSVYCR